MHLLKNNVFIESEKEHNDILVKVILNKYDYYSGTSEKT